MLRESKILIAIFFCSFSSLAYEITLTRIFSVSLSYHFAFMIISIAMLGIGASGTLLSLYPGFKKIENINRYCFLLGLSITLSYLIANQLPFDPVKLSWSWIELLHIPVYYMTLCLPFFFTGLIIATSLSSLSKKSGVIYSADLIGAGLGSMGILCLLSISAPEKAVFLLSSIALLAAVIMSRRRLRVAGILLILFNFSILLMQPQFAQLRMSPYKGLQVALRSPDAYHIKTYSGPFSRLDTFVSPIARFAPGLSLRYLDPLPEQTGLSIDGTEMNAVTAVKDKELLYFVRFLPSALPYEIGSKNDVLILDPKGGLQVLVAKAYGSGAIVKIESNPLILDVVSRDFKNYSGEIYADNAWTGLGRSWLRSNTRQFDIIDISLTTAVPSGAFGIAEDYRFTVEAFIEYLAHLKQDGYLNMNLFILPPPRIELRLFTTAVTALEMLGYKNASSHVAVLRSWGTICMLVRKTPLGIEAIEAIKRFAQERRFDLVYYPGIREDETNIFVKMPTEEYFLAFKELVSLQSRPGFLAQYLFDVNPVSDDQPFFHYYLRIDTIPDIYRTMGQKWQFFIEEGYLTPMVFLQVLLLSLLLTIAPLLTKYRRAIHVTASFAKGYWFLPYFAFLGIGYMSIEIPLIQKNILPLEYPALAVAVVITSLLISSGAGSFLSRRLQQPGMPLLILTLSILTIVYSLFIPVIVDALFIYALPIKIISVFAIIMPLGMLMGIPFPSGLRMLGENNESLIPLAWAINGCLSVLTPIAAIMLATAAGFKFVLWIGACAYLLSAVNLWICMRQK